MRVSPYDGVIKTRSTWKYKLDFNEPYFSSFADILLTEIHDTRVLLPTHIKKYLENLALF